MMRARYLWAMLIALGSPVAAMAASAPQDKKLIATCLERVADGLGTQCIGIVADPCIRAIKDDDTAGSKARACAARELAVWEDEMSAVLKAIDAAGRDIKAPVSLAQQSWRESRDKLCPIFDKIDPGMFVGGANHCRLHETARRALVLRKLAAAVGEH
jgi:hypothetical protein